MQRRTRLFVLGAAGILVVGLGTGLVASYMGGLQNFAIVGANGPAELQYVSPEAKWVAFANVREIMDSELRQKIRELHPASATPEEFQEQTGIDIDRDIDKVLASASGADLGAAAGRPLLLARGRFDQTRIEGLVREHGGSASDHKGKRLLTVVTKGDEPDFAVAFIEPDLVGLGTLSAVREAIDRKDAGGNVTSNADMMRLIRDIDDGNAWAVARFDVLANGPNVPREIASRLPAITWFAVSGHVNGGIRGTVRAETRDEASAQDLREVIRGFMALARMQVGQRTDFADLLDSIQLSGQGTAVALDFAVPTELIDALGAMRAQRPDAPNPSLDPLPPAPPLPPLPPDAPPL